MSEEKDTVKGRKSEKQQTFEVAMERLEKIVEEMESGNLDLETMIARFEEGQKLIKFCSTKLNEIEKRVEILVKKGDEFVAEPFEPSDEDESPKSGGKPGHDSGAPF